MTEIVIRSPNYHVFKQWKYLLDLWAQPEGLNEILHTTPPLLWGWEWGFCLAQVLLCKNIRVYRPGLAGAGRGGQGVLFEALLFFSS